MLYDEKSKLWELEGLKIAKRKKQVEVNSQTPQREVIGREISAMSSVEEYSFVGTSEKNGSR